MTFPIVLKTTGFTAPQVSIYYEVTENGVFQVRETSMYRAVTRNRDAIPGLLPECESLKLKCPRLPRRQGEEVLAFFDEVYRRHRAEAIVLLFYSDTTREYRIAVPPQTISGRWWHDGRWRPDHALQYGAVDRPPGFVRCGTIHSHADLPAYSSGIDSADEQFEDGLHVVFGDFDRRELSISAAFVANGVRFQLAPSGVLEPCQIPHRPPPGGWLDLVTIEDHRVRADYSGDDVHETATRKD